MCKLAVAVRFHLMTMRLVIFSLNLVGIKIAITKTYCNYWSVIVYKQIHLLRCRAVISWRLDDSQIVVVIYCD